MGGGDKALSALGEGTILDAVARRLAPQCHCMVLNANGDPARFRRIGLPVVADRIADHPGPLAGVCTVLEWTARHRPGIAWVATVGCDLPWLPPDLVAGLHAARRAAGAPLAMAASGGRIHPVCALWPVGMAREIATALARGERRIGQFAEENGAATATWPKEPRDPFFNVNTPIDLDEVRRAEPPYL